MAEISTIARPYAHAIFDLAKDQKKLNDWSEMLKLLSGVVENDSIKSVIQDSKILESDKEKLLFNICQKKISSECENLIKLLI